MLERLKKYEEQFIKNRKALLEVESSDSLIPEVVYNNNLLLVTGLKKLFKDEKAQYLPKTVRLSLDHNLKDVENLLTSIDEPPNEATYTTQALESMDVLYAGCLQYGLITFGFDGKEASQVVQGLRNKISGVEANIAQLNKEMAGNAKKLKTETQTASEKLNLIEKEAVGRINEELNVFKKHSVSLTDELSRQTEDFKNVIEENKHSAVELLSEITTQRDAAKQATDSCTQQMAEISNTHTSTTQKLSEITDFTSKANEQLVSVQTHTKDAIAQLQNATKAATDAKAKDDATAQHLANAKQRQQEIDSFYQEIEAHKEEMLEFKKQSDANYNELKNNCDEKVQEYTEKADAIVSENQTLQEKIEALLQQAVGAGLFGVFEQRGKMLEGGKNFWKWATIIFAILSTAGIGFLAFYGSSNADLLFFIRIGIMGPFIYLMVFTSGQYKKERQAEEEYAFKSAISFSLEPYRDLLMKMREDEELEADFVKRLMEDIFDNPVKRLYNHKDDRNELEELMDAVKTVSGKMPKEKKKAFDELARNFVSEFLDE